MTKRQLLKEKTRLVHEIQSIKSDYRGVFPEDMPIDVTQELAELMRHLREVRAELDTK